MDGKCVRAYFANEVNSLNVLYKQFEILVPSQNGKGAAHAAEDGRYVETLIRECLKKFLPSGVEVLTGFIMRPSVKSGDNDKSRKKDKDEYSQQLDIIVYDSARYPVYLRFDRSVVVPPEGVIGIISVKKTLNISVIEHELKALHKAGELCRPDKKKYVRGPFLAIVSMDYNAKQITETSLMSIFGKMKTCYGKIAKLRFNNAVGVITALSSFSIFKSSPSPKGNPMKAEYVGCLHKENDYLGLQFILSGLLSVYYDSTRNTVARPGFTAFEQRDSMKGLGDVATVGL